MTDLSPRETAARALEGHPTYGSLYSGNPAELRGLADAVLAAVAAHDGLADELRGHIEAPVWAEHDGVWSWRCPCDAVLFGTEGAPTFRTVPGVKFLTLAHAAHLADVVRAWMVQP